MAKLEIYLCDGCGVESVYDQVWAAGGWYHVRASFDAEAKTMPRYYACSLDCLVLVARQLRGDNMAADPLETLFAAPAAVKATPKPRALRKPRKPGT